MCDLNVAISRDHWTSSGFGPVTDFTEIKAHGLFKPCDSWPLSFGAIGAAGHLQGICRTPAGHRQLPHRCSTDDSLSFATPRGDDSLGKWRKTEYCRDTPGVEISLFRILHGGNICEARASGLGRVLAAADDVGTAGPPPDDGTIYFLAR